MKRRLEPFPASAQQAQRGLDAVPQSADLREPWIGEHEAALHCGYPDTAKGHHAFRQWVRTSGAPCGSIGRRYRFKRSRLDWFIKYGQQGARRRRSKGAA